MSCLFFIANTIFKLFGGQVSSLRQGNKEDQGYLTTAMVDDFISIEIL